MFGKTHDKFQSVKKQNLNLKAHMVLLNFLVIIEHKIIGMLIKYLHANEYYLTMKAHLEEKTSLLKK